MPGVHDTSSAQINMPSSYERDSLLQDWDSFFPAENVSAQGGRIKEAMFPTLSQSSLGNSNVDKLTPAVQNLVDGVMHLLHYKDDALVTEAVLPQLINMMIHNDPEAVAHATSTVYTLARKEAPRHALTQNHELCPALAHVLMDNSVKSSSETKRQAMATMVALSDDPKGRQALFRGQTISALVRMLGDPHESIVKYALSTLHNMLTYMKPDVVGPIRLAGGVTRMAHLLSPTEMRNWSDRFYAILCSSLEMLCMGDIGSKGLVADGNSLGTLSGQVEDARYEKLAYTSVRLLCTLSAYSAIKPDIIQADGVRALMSAYAAGANYEKAVQETSLWALRNLSDKVESDENIQPLLAECLHILSGSSNHADILKQCAAGILCNLTCNSESNKVYVVENGGVDALIQTISEASEALNIKEPAVCALRHITSRNELAEDARKQVGKKHLIGELKNGLSDCSRITITQVAYKKAVLGLVRNLALSKECRSRMKDVRLIQEVYALLNELVALDHDHNVTLQELDIDSVIDGCLGAIHVLLRDEVQRNILLESDPHSVVSTLTEFISRPSINFQREAVGSLCELVQIDACKHDIRGHIPALSQLLQSPNESVATYAAYAIYYCEDAEQSTEKSEMIERSLFTVREDEQFMNDEQHNFANENTLLIDDTDV